MVSKLSMEIVWCLLTGRCLVGGVCGSPSPADGFKCHIAWNAATCASVGAIVWTVMASSHNSIMSGKVWCARFTSSRFLNRMTDSTTVYWSTPNGQACALLMQISMMSSSVMEEASIGVPSPLVIEINSNRNESGDGTSWSLDAVAEEVTQIVEGIYLNLIEISLCWSGSNRFTYITHFNICYNIIGCYLR